LTTQCARAGARGRPGRGRVPARASQPKTAARLAATVEDAAARGVFGVPSFVLGADVYFGHDRLVLLRHTLRKTAGATT
jgi:2-hydroxychromene-2-carboxylate isomerase